MASSNFATHIVMQNGKIWGYNGGTQTDLLTSISTGVPYRLKVVINTSTKKFDVHVNDQLRGSQWSYRYSTVSKLDKIWMSEDQTLNRSMSFDDVKVSYMPQTPGNVQASALSDTSIGLTWSAVPGAAEYRVFRSASPDTGFEPISAAGLTGLSYTDYNLSANSTYYYKVAAVSQQAVSIDSATASAKTLPPADQTAPVTTPLISGTAGQGGWYRQDVTVTLSAYDAGSGIANTQYKLNDGAWTPYTVPVAISGEGTNTFQFYSTDKAGNAEAAQTVTILLDRTAPLLTLTHSGQPVHDVLLLDTVQFALTVSDQLSGAASKSLLLDGEAIASGDSISALQIGLGTHPITAAAADLAGNTAEQSWTFSVGVNFSTFHAWLTKLLQDGQIKNGGIQTSLDAKLNHAESRQAKGHPDQAVKHLNDLTNMLDTYINNGNVNAQAANDLKQAIQYFITAGL